MEKVFTHDRVVSFRRCLHLLNLTRIERLSIRVIAIAIVADILIASVAFRVHFHQIPVAEALITPTAIQVGTSTEAFIRELELNTDSKAIKNVSRKQFSVPGTLVTLHNDNIQIFEYPTVERATEYAATLSTYYYAQRNKLTSEKEQVHIYQSGPLVIFYFGTNEHVLKALSMQHGLAHM